MHSCIYEGTVTHRRTEPVNHWFQYRLFMVYLDLDELPAVVSRQGMIADGRHTSRSFLRSDHLFDTSKSLSSEVRELVQSHTGQTSRGPIRLLTQLRYFGYYMSPLNLYYLFDEDGMTVEFIVAEVNNTPWKERHCYVLWQGNGTQRETNWNCSHPKEFHVSPFMDMNMEYRWHVTKPGEGLAVRLANFQAHEQLFEASMKLQRRTLNRQQLRRMTLRYPLMTVQIVAAIYLQALKLWWKQCPSYTHPKKQRAVARSRQPLARRMATKTTNGR